MMCFNRVNLYNLYCRVSQAVNINTAGTLVGMYHATVLLLLLLGRWSIKNRNRMLSGQFSVGSDCEDIWKPY